MEYDFEAMGKRIKQRRLDMKLKQKDLAEKLDVSNNHISSIEQNKSQPSIELLLSLCDTLNTTPDYLLLGTAHPHNLPQNIYDKLTLCTDDQLDTINAMVEYFTRLNHTLNR